jgi:hypothetical protein
VRALAYFLVLLVMAVWAGWTGYGWAIAIRRSDVVTEAAITRAWPVGKRQLELRERIREAQEQARRSITTRFILRGGIGLVVLHLVSLGLKDRSST